MNGLMTSQEAANYLQIKYRTLEIWAREGKIKAYKVGDYWRFKLEDLESFLELRVNRAEGGLR